MNKTHLDLFSGVGGFALACRWLGIETVGFSEIDDYASRVLAKNFPGVTNYGDVRNVPAIDNVWLVTGGFPCQPFSVAGKRAGAADDRHLWPEMLRVIEQTKPTWIIAENVAGITSMVEYDSAPPMDDEGCAIGEAGNIYSRDGWGYFNEVLASLEALGYDVQPVSIPACAVDAPHRRERVWVVAYADESNGRWRAIQQERQAQKGVASNWNGADVPHTHGTGLGQVANETAYRRGDGESIRLCRWQLEPGICRVANGIPKRVDRLRGLGNAIVPQVAYQIIKMMIEVEHGNGNG